MPASPGAVLTTSPPSIRPAGNPALGPSIDREREPWITLVRPSLLTLPPRRLHISRRYGHPYPHAPRMTVGRLVPAGLLARGSGACLSLPAGRKTSGRSGIDEAGSPLTVAGAARDSEPRGPSPMFPFHPPGLMNPGRNRHEDEVKREGGGGVNRGNAGRAAGVAKGARPVRARCSFDRFPRL